MSRPQRVRLARITTRTAREGHGQAPGARSTSAATTARAPGRRPERIDLDLDQVPVGANLAQEVGKLQRVLGPTKHRHGLAGCRLDVAVDRLGLPYPRCLSVDGVELVADGIVERYA